MNIKDKEIEDIQFLEFPKENFVEKNEVSGMGRSVSRTRKQYTTLNVI